MQITNKTTEVKYTDKEITQMIYNDLKQKGVIEEGDEIVSLSDIKRESGSIPLGPFDEDKIYVFGGIKLSIKKNK